MNSVNRTMSAIFDVVLAPLEMLGIEWAIIVVSCVVGIVGLILFKFISWQKGIKGVKDKIKGNLIAIRIYQDDLIVVFKSVAKILFRNVQYLTLNFGPILPLLPPFALVLAQLVVRYGYDPLPVVSVAEAEAMLPGQGTMVKVSLKKERAAEAKALSVEFPEGIRQLSPLVRSSDGWASVEIAAIAPVVGDIQVKLDGRTVGTKALVAGDEPTRRMQPQRVSSFWSSWLYPAEETFEADSPLDTVAFVYPERDLRYLMGGEFGILVVFAVFSILAGAAVLKPLNIQI